MAALLRRSWGWRVLCASGVLLPAALSPLACLNRPIDNLTPRSTSTHVDPLTQSRIDKIDLLLSIDNSISMGDKQSLLAEAIPDLMRRLVLPRCLDAITKQPSGTAATAEGKCPEGQKPEFKPVTDIHVGIVSSSLGDFTTGACQSASVENPDDQGHLLSRKSGGGVVKTFEDKGFLAWDPLGNVGGINEVEALEQSLGAMVLGVDQKGCGYEMQLESIVRFLVDPEPYAQLEQEGDWLRKAGTDDVLLQQRADFLRPDSLVTVLLLSDENDCSVDPAGQGFKALAAPFYRATDECALDPNDPCCTSCALTNPTGCAPDPATCGPGQGTAGANRYSNVEDPSDRRCWEQKRRYGVDFLYPTARYINALSKEEIDPARADLAVVAGSTPIRNPLFAASDSGLPRSPDLVYLAGIVGVPWQAVARKNEAGQPDLSLGFSSVEELQKTGAITALVGDPDGHILPSDPFMLESFAPRSGASALMGYSLPGNNPINGGDRTGTFTDLQYSCIFPLKDPDPVGHDCKTCIGPTCDNPLCNGTTQVAAKAYPGLRELAVVTGLGTQGIVASICPEHQDPSRPDTYGYGPVVRTIVDRLSIDLVDKCLPTKLDPEDDGTVQCLVIEARLAEGEACCDGRPGRQAIDPESAAFNAVRIAQEYEFNPGWDCFCEIEQLRGNDKTSCQNDTDPQGIDGFCYIDASVTPPIGSEALVPESCAADERRILRFVGGGEPLPKAVAFITCAAGTKQE